MEEYQYLIDKYFGMPTWDSQSISQYDKVKAKHYLEQYWLDREEYEYCWEAILKKIFITGYRIFDPLFPDDYGLIAMLGGRLFTEDSFHALMNCFQAAGDKHFVIIENTADENPPIRLKFPTNISWKEFRDGDFIATVIIDMHHREYFVYTDKSKCGKYVSSDHRRPLHLIAFKKEYEDLFKQNFQVSKEEWEGMYNEWLPGNCKNRVMDNSQL
jgi:hypothetical protein